jgi:hypothetical protein
VLELGSAADRVWVTLQSGGSKVAIVEAQLLYTLNPKPFDSTQGHREEWFHAPATISAGRVDAIMPPGATHALFCMRDANGFLVTSEPVPSYHAAANGVKDSTIVKNGYAYKPGLFALIQLGEQARAASKQAGVSIQDLNTALTSAQQQFAAETIDERQMCDAIRTLRAAIRNQHGTPESKHPLINRFPTDPLF